MRGCGVREACAQQTHTTNYAVIQGSPQCHNVWRYHGPRRAAHVCTVWFARLCCCHVDSQCIYRRHNAAGQLSDAWEACGVPQKAGLDVELIALRFLLRFTSSMNVFAGERRSHTIIMLLADTTRNVLTVGRCAQRLFVMVLECVCGFCAGLTITTKTSFWHSSCRLATPAQECGL